MFWTKREGLNIIFCDIFGEFTAKTCSWAVNSYKSFKMMVLLVQHGPKWLRKILEGPIVSLEQFGTYLWGVYGPRTSLAVNSSFGVKMKCLMVQHTSIGLRLIPFMH